MIPLSLDDYLDWPEVADARDDLLERVLPTTRTKLVDALARYDLTSTFGDIDRAIDEWIRWGWIRPDFDLLPDTKE